MSDAAELPSTWTAWRSAAVLMFINAWLSKSTRRDVQLERMWWELEKYGPTFCEPPAPVIVDDATAFIARVGIDDPLAVASMHGTEILRRRGREALDLTVAACARLAALGTYTPTHTTLLHQVVTRSRGVSALGDADGPREMGFDEAGDFADFGELPVRPDETRLRGWLDACIAIAARPPDWTAAHALAFLVYAAAHADRSTSVVVPEKVTRALADFATAVGCTSEPSELLERARSLYDQTKGVRFVVLRAVEDQAMLWVSSEPKLRAAIVGIVNYVAVDGGLTALRRAIITATMGVLATSPKALVRPRACVEWPRA
ncbi:MAG TPA: hypothetical protein VGG74_04000 [Kofleriaceae bacterium]|jgi:hypothetical protein